jgi:superfamily II DNA or RNA helicase
MRSSIAAPIGAFTSSRIENLIEAMAAFSPPMRQRGKEYAIRARVGSLRFLPEAFGARVRGTRLYEVWWRLVAGRWAASCTCPVGYGCKHQYAVACCVLDPLRAQVSERPRRLGRLLPDHPIRHAAIDPPDPSRRTSTSTDEEDLSDLEGDPGTEANFTVLQGATVSLPNSPRTPRPATPKATASWRPLGLSQLRTARNRWNRVLALERLLADNPRVRVPIYSSIVGEILAEEDFDIMCWRLANALPQWTEGWLPVALEPYREREDLHERLTARLRAELEARMAEWSPNRPERSDRSLRFVIGRAPTQDGAASVTVEARLTSKRMTDEPREIDQLYQLLRLSQREPGTLPPEQVLLLDAYLTNSSRWSAGGPEVTGGVTTTTLKRLIELGSGSAALVWDENLDPEWAVRWGVSPGDPARLGGRPVNIVPSCVPEERGPILDLEVVWADGRRRLLRRTLLLAGMTDGSRRHPTLVVADGEFNFVAEEPPPDVTESFLATGGLPLDRDAHAPLIERLAQRFPSIRETLGKYLRVRAVEPVIAVDLRENDWVQIRLFAVATGSEWQPIDRPGPDVFLREYAPEDVWQEFSETGRRAPITFLPTGSESAVAVSEEPSDAPDSGWFELLDDVALRPATEWLSSTVVAGGDKASSGSKERAAPDRNVGWWLRLTPRAMTGLAAAWEARPRSVRWYCSVAAKRMLSEARPIRPFVRVESTGIDWFQISAEWEAEGLALTEADLAAVRRATTPFVRVSNGWVRREGGTEVGRAAEALADLGIEPGGGTQRVSVWQLAQAAPESLAALEEFGADAAAATALQCARERVAAFRGLPRIRVPREFKGTLRPYQQQGVEFLAYVSSFGLGSILADDMGLGKTVQALAWLLWLRKQTPDLGPALVVCPASVVHNWAREAERFTPGLRVTLLTSGARRGALLREASRHDVLVTNYALLRRDIESWRKIPLGVVILDEAQNIKNPDAGVSRAARELQAQHRLALTGTPLENRALDLWSILAFASPGLLGSRAAFTARYERTDAAPHLRRLLAARLRPVLLRRLKSEVARELPERIEERRDCEMHPAQRRLYLDELVRSQALVRSLAGEPQGLNRHRIEILAALTRLRQICCHPALIDGGPTVGSGKFDALWEILEPLMAEGHKVLLFSQFVRCLRLLESGMRERGIAYHLLTGQTRKREEVVSRFQDDTKPGVFLISLKAGGTGLNLTAAGYVVLFDPWWNPAVEAQAIDRTHRIGQTQNVIAYRLVTRGTVEEKIWELQQRKATMAREILGEDGFAKTLTRDDLEFLLTPEP